MKGSTLFSLTDLGHLSRFYTSFITFEIEIKEEVCGTQSESSIVLAASTETEHMELTMKEYDAILITNINDRTASSCKISFISVLFVVSAAQVLFLTKVIVLRRYLSNCRNQTNLATKWKR